MLVMYGWHILLNSLIMYDVNLPSSKPFGSMDTYAELFPVLLSMACMSVDRVSVTAR